MNYQTLSNYNNGAILHTSPDIPCNPFCTFDSYNLNMNSNGKYSKFCNYMNKKGKVSFTYTPEGLGNYCNNVRCKNICSGVYKIKY